MSEEVIASHFDRLRGRILGLIESWGLPPVQERGCKGIFKSLTYDMEAEITQSRDELVTTVADLARTGLEAWARRDEAKFEAVLELLAVLDK